MAGLASWTDQALNCGGMKITLTKDLAAFVNAKVRSGGYTSTSEVVREALRELRAKDNLAEIDSPELAALLLPAVRGPHRPLSEGDFEMLRERTRRKRDRS